MKVELGPNGVGQAAVWTPSGAPASLLPDGVHSTLIDFGPLLPNFQMYFYELLWTNKVYIVLLILAA